LQCGKVGTAGDASGLGRALDAAAAAIASVLLLVVVIVDLEGRVSAARCDGASHSLASRWLWQRVCVLIVVEVDDLRPRRRRHRNCAKGSPADAASVRAPQRPGQQDAQKSVGGAAAAVVTG
jgi:hypothetical protein